jgi:transposase InsO family protein
MAQGFSERRATRLTGLGRSSLRYERRPMQDDVAERVMELAARHPRFGHRRIWALLRRTGIKVNRKRIHRLFKLGGLSLKVRKPRKKIRTGKKIPMQARYPNQVWTYDFVFDQAMNGNVLKCLTVEDEFTREALAIEVRGSFRASHVIAILQELFQRCGYPAFLRSDNGPEFVAKAVRIWLGRLGSQTFYIPPGKPWNNGFIESFNSKLRDECLDREAFASRTEAKVLIENFRQFYSVLPVSVHTAGF